VRTQHLNNIANRPSKRSALLPRPLRCQHLGATEHIITIMAYKRKRTTYKSKRYAKRSSRRSTKRYPKRTLDRAIKQVVRRHMETKCNQGTSAQINVNNIIAADDCYFLYPSITQGTGQSERIGNKIQPVYFNVKLLISCNDVKGIIASPTPTYFDIYIFKLKQQNAYAGPPTSTDMTKFLQSDNTSISYTGDTLSGLRPVNDDLFTLVTKRRCVLSNMTNSTATLNIGAPVMPARTYSFNLTKHVKKTIIFDDNNGLMSNDNMFIAVGSSQMDGTSTGESLTGRYHLMVEMKYKDA